MISQLVALLSSLRLSDAEEKKTRTEIDVWLKGFLPKIKRETTRKEQCRLLASVERMEFGNNLNAEYWQFCRFVGKEVIIFDEDKNELERLKQTSLQRKILSKNPNLENVEISRWKILAEEGKWNLKENGSELEKKKISAGGEAVIFEETFGNLKTAVRVQVFEPFLFTKHFGVGEIKTKTNLISGKFSFQKSGFIILDFGKATDKPEEDMTDDKRVVPVHENVVRNLANIEIFDSGDSKEEDCLGWITIMEKAHGNLRKQLKEEKLDLDERKKIANGIVAGLDYLAKVGIFHFDEKLENFLLLGGVAKVCDFGLVREWSGRRSYRQMGYTRWGSKYREWGALCKLF